MVPSCPCALGMLFLRFFTATAPKMKTAISQLTDVGSPVRRDAGKWSSAPGKEQCTRHHESRLFGHLTVKLCVNHIRKKKASMTPCELELFHATAQMWVLLNVNLFADIVLHEKK